MFRKNCKVFWNLKTAMCQQKSQSPAHVKGFLLTLRRMFQESLNVFEWFLQLNIFGNGYDPPLEFLKYYLFLHFGPIMLLEVHNTFSFLQVFERSFFPRMQNSSLSWRYHISSVRQYLVTSASASCSHLHRHLKNMFIYHIEWMFSF